MNPVERLRLPLVLLLLTACGARPEEAVAPQVVALVDEPRACIKNEPELVDMLDEVVPHPRCALDSECPCGTNCDEDGFCVAECVTATHPQYGCAGNETCDNWGQCRPVIDAGTPGTSLPLLQLDPTIVTLDAPNPSFATTQVTVTITSTDATLSTHPERQPTVRVTGASSAGDGASELEVACTVAGTFTDSCLLEPPYTFTPVNGVLTTTRSVFVRPKSSATAKAWDLRFFSDGVGNAPAHVSLVRRAAVSLPFAGSYDGALDLVGGVATGALPAHVPARVLAAGESILLLDDAHLLSPSGRLRFTRNQGPQRTTWLARGGDADVVAEITLVTLDHDASSGRLSGSFLVRLPDWQGAPAGTSPSTQTWSFDFKRQGPLPGAACLADTSCAAGSVCDSVLATCVPGPHWEPLALTAPVNAIASPGLSADGQSLAASLKIAYAGDVTVDGAERLLCYKDAIDAYTRVDAIDGLELGGDVLPVSGELACANGNAQHAIRLPVLRDAGTSKSLAQVLSACLGDLASTTSEFSVHDCISLARTLPALQILSASSTRYDRRAGLLLQHLLKDWLSVHAYIARQGLETYKLQRAVPSGPTLDLAAVLDRTAAGWNLLLDAVMSTTLLELPPSVVRSSDYRGGDRPVAYWPSSDTDVEPAHLNLRPGSGASYINLAGDGPLSRDLSVTFTAIPDRFKNASGVALDSPWLRARFESPSGNFYERGYMRSGAIVAGPAARDWYACMAWAVTQHAVAWTWDAPFNGQTYRCWAYTTLGEAVLPHSGASPWVYTGYLQAWPDSDSYTGTTEDNYMRYGGTMYLYTPGTSWQTCQSVCENEPTCQAWSFGKTTHECYIQSTPTIQPLPLKSYNANVISGLSSRGRRLEAKASFFEDNARYTGTVFKTPPTNTWVDCHDACVQDASCEAWTYTKGGTTCQLMSGIGVGTAVYDASYVSARRGGIDLLGAHRVASGGTYQFRMHVSDLLHMVNTSFTIVRRNRERRYQVYTAAVATSTAPAPAPRPGTTLPPRGTLGGFNLIGHGGLGGIETGGVLEQVGWPSSFAFSELPYWPASARLNVGRGAPYLPIADVAVFDTALDVLAVRAIHARRGVAPNPVTRAPLESLAGTNYDQPLGLPVKMLATLESEDALLATYLDGQLGAAAAECAQGGATPTRDALLARAGDTLRRGALALSLADTLYGRATQVSCTSDALCTPLGGHCGAPRREISLNALSMTRVGTMGVCSAGQWSDPQGICQQGAPWLPRGTASGTITVTDAGDYALWARVVARSEGQNSLLLQIDGGAWIPWDLPVDPSSDENAWIWRRALQLNLSAGPHTIVIRGVEPNAIVRELRFTDDLGTTPPGVRDDVCYGNDGLPLRQAPAWDDAFVKGRQAATAATSALLDSVAKLGECKNPLGVETGDLPLYFKDPIGSTSRYFASSDYLMSNAQAAVDRAGGLFAQAREAWVLKQDAQYQHDVTLAEAQKRVEQIAQSYEAPLSDLCGSSSTTPGALLEALANGSLDAKACFVTQTATCLSNFNGPVLNVDPACYHGQLGEGLLGLKAAALKVAEARQVWNAKQSEYEHQSSLCVFKQGTQDIVDAHYETMEALRFTKSLFDGIARVVGNGVLIGASAYSGNVVGVFTGFLNISTGFANDAVNDENEKFEEEMSKRSSAQDVMTCWAAADALRNAIETARLEMLRAAVEASSAQLAFAEGRRKEQQLIAQGVVAMNREKNRSIIRPEFDYWLDEKMVSFQKEFVWAKRLTFLTLLAVEYDFQTSLTLRQQILDAQKPADLAAALLSLAQVQSTYQVYGSRPQSKFIVLSLADDILKLKGTNLEQAAQLREILRDHAQRVTDASGNLLGTGIKFALTPASVPALADRCGERVWSTTAEVAMDSVTPTYRMHLRLLGSNTFASQWCTPGGHETEMQVSSIRPTVNLFLPTSSAVPFVNAPPRTACDIDAPVASASLQELYRDAPPDGSVTDFAGRGMYGDYVLLFRANDPAIDLTRIQDVYLRFDYLSVAAQ
jgi:hypothetical protein